MHPQDHTVIIETNRLRTLLKHSVSVACLAGLLCTLMGMQAWRFAPWRIGTPIAYYTPSPSFEAQRDSLTIAAIAQIIAEEGWYFTSPRLGQPDGMDLSYTPMLDNGHMLGLKFLTKMGLGALVAVNCYYFLTFFLAAAIAAWVLVALEVSPPIAIVGGVLYGLLPYHFGRNVVHLFLSGYFWVPLAVFVLLQVAPWRNALRTKQAWFGTLLVCAYVPAFGLYYTYFFCFLLCAFVCADFIAWRNMRSLATSLAMLAITVLSTVAQALPSLSAGAVGMVVRQPVESEVYGLRLVQMLLPAMARLLDSVKPAQALYIRTALLQNENQTVDLGIVVGLCWLVMFVVGLAWSSRNHFDGNAGPLLVQRLFQMAMVAFTYGTMGGISSLTAYLFVPQIRSVNRIIVYIAFCAIAAAALLLQRLQSQGVRLGKWSVIIILLAALTMAQVDASQNHPAVDYSLLHKIYTADAHSFARLEAMLPARARVFNLPHIAFPEGQPAPYEYDTLRPFLHTKQLTWSFGAAEGMDSWNVAAAAALSHDSQSFMSLLHDRKFVGVLLYRPADAKVAEALEPQLVTALGPPSFESDDHEFVYFPLPHR